MTRIYLPDPELQIEFFFALATIRGIYLQEALSMTVKDMDIAQLDAELSQYVPQDNLRAIASRGLRGELAFAVPVLLERNPKLLGYYRLLLGFSQKSFYSSDTGLSSCKAMEEKGNLSDTNREKLPALCRALISCASVMIHGIGAKKLNRELLDDLTILSIGPQLRGGANVRKGIASISQVFETIRNIVEHAIVDAYPNRIDIQNAAGRQVYVEFAPDPDIIIREEMAENVYRNIIAIEIKGGTDFSNIHNRIGEAEKSHQKARGEGYVECWTIVNVDKIDFTMARTESPSTNRFYLLSNLSSSDGEEYQDFRNRIISLTGISHNT